MARHAHSFEVICNPFNRHPTEKELSWAVQADSKIKTGNDGLTFQYPVFHIFKNGKTSFERAQTFLMTFHQAKILK